MKKKHKVTIPHTWERKKEIINRKIVEQKRLNCTALHRILNRLKETIEKMCGFTCLSSARAKTRLNAFFCALSFTCW